MQQSRFIFRHALLYLSVVAFVSLTGCVALPLATLGSVLGFAGTAASTGSDVYNLGKLDFSTMASFEESQAAVVGASNDLKLHITKGEFVGKRTDEYTYELTDDRGKKIDVRVDRRAGNLCQCRVNVGIFGFEPTAKLIMDRIRSHLPEAGNTAAQNRRRPQRRLPGDSPFSPSIG